jgi:MFS family permease
VSSPAATTPDRDGGGRERSLQRSEKRVVALLGLPTLVFALAVTVVTTYLPVVATGFVGSKLVIGLVVGVEGLFALWLPLVIGVWSDRLRTRLGGRLPFVLAGAPVLAVGLVAMAWVGSLPGLIAAATVFFAGYFVAYEPYRALYPDAVPDEVAGRAQGTQALWRGAGTGIALLGGGLLLALGRPAPFLAATVVVVVGTAGFGLAVIRRGVPESPRPRERGARRATSDVVRLVSGSRPLKAFLVANALWELSLGALKTFIVLYVTAGLGFTRAEAALIIGGVAVIVLLAAVTGGRLADRFGHVPVLRAALPAYGLGMLLPMLFTSHALIIAAIPFVAIGGGVLMALPYAVLMPLMPDTEHGTLTGYYSFSRGIGTWLGPALAGLAISTLDGVFPSTNGYQAMWLVCSLAALASLPLLGSLRAR